MGRDLIGGPMRVFQPQSLTKMFTRLLLRVRKAQPRAQERKFLPQLLVPAAPPHLSGQDIIYLLCWGRVTIWP